MAAYGEHAAEVAADYRQALEDLTVNTRYEISNLTLIARENTESAMAISDVLLDHIKKVAPHKKLPALYVLDSIVKNVGTPYTIFFGRRLYTTFMEAYSLVDNNTRRKMEEMLQTWKQPVPGSIDTRPVFPAEIVRPIESALLKAKTSMFRAEQEHMRSQQQLLGGRGRSPQLRPDIPWRETPTPPGVHQMPNVGGYGQQQAYPPTAGGPPPQAIASYPPQPGPSRSTPQPSLPSHPVPVQQGQARNSPQPAAPPAISIDALDSDIQALIDSLKAEFALRPFDGAIQTKLKALLDLQTIVRSSNLPQEQLVQVKNQVAELSVNIKATGSATPVPGSQPPVASVGTPVQGAPPAAAPAGTPQLSLDSILGPGALAALMARNAAAAATSVPQAAVPAPPPPPTIIRSPPPSQYTTAPPPPPPAQPSAPANSLASNPQALLEMLRKAGLITPTPPTSGAGPAAGGPPPPPAAVRSPPPLPIANPIPIPPALPQGIASLLSPSTQPGGSGGSVRQPIETLFNDIQLQTWSLKQWRPYLLPLLHDDLGPPCTQCGRRFRTDTDIGRKRKAAHMDWHFRVHRRLADAERRSQHRSWYVSENDWVHSREDEEENVGTATAPAAGAAEGGEGSSGGPGAVPGFDGDAGGDGRRWDGSVGGAGSGGGATSGRSTSAGARGGLRYIAVPDDASLTNSVCPVCQERFEMKWLDEAQEWVWMDAVRVGDRVFHASCHREAYGGSGGGGAGVASGASGVSRYGNRGTPDPVLGKRKAEPGW